MTKRAFGNMRQLPSGRWQARYTDAGGRIRKAPVTFDAKIDAEGWLSRQRAAIIRGTWLDPIPEPEAVAPIPVPPVITLRAYAEAWLTTRELSPSTRRLYRLTLDNQILKGLGDVAVTGITPPMVRQWHARLDTGPRQRAAAYALLRTILGTAVADDAIPANPCRVRGAGQSPRSRQPRPASLPELAAIVTAMPARYKLMVLLAAWCALRFGELAELRAGDVDTVNGVIHVRRGVVRGSTGKLVKDPKSDAGKRDVWIPPHLMTAVRDHLRDQIVPNDDALLFPAERGGHLAPTTLYGMFYPARDAAGRPDLRFHDLRHTGAVLAAATGATLAELMARLGHSTVSAAMRYQHAAADRDKAIAEALSKLATVTPITAAKSTKRKEATSS